MNESQNLPLVYVLGTGGSISCIGESSTDFINYSYGDRHYSIEEMLSRVPEAGDLARVKAEQFSNVAGGDLPLNRRFLGG